MKINSDCDTSREVARSGRPNPGSLLQRVVAKLRAVKRRMGYVARRRKRRNAKVLLTRGKMALIEFRCMECVEHCLSDPSWCDASAQVELYATVPFISYQKE